ncbi:MAG TPA: hypothetical protein VJV21_01815 [Pyrinomonadaceae bacterium]|nr:hypothetical protein [Pyrinomonadaceae bacterium]
MNSSCFRRRASTIISCALALTFFAAPLRAQQQPASPPPSQPQAATKPEPTFDTLLSADSYKMYVEVRNVGTLLTTGGAGEIIDPIVKLADPGPQLKSLLKFLRDNAEPLAGSRLMIATWPVRRDIPSTMAALEFASADEAAKFAPKLETFLPTVLPPVPVEEPTPESSPPADVKPETSAKSNDAKTKPAPPAAAKPKASPVPREMRSPFVLTQAGPLVLISDRAFKIEKLHPPDAALLSEDKNFRVARDRFGAEPLFLFFNVALEDRSAPKPSPTPVISDEERERIEREQEAEIQRLAEEVNASQQKTTEGVAIDISPQGPKVQAVLSAGPSPFPTPPPTKEQQAQTVASNQIGSMLSMLGQGQPQWPEAIGVALVLDSDEFAVRAILIQKENAKTLPIPFLPQLISGSAVASEAASILPDDTEVLVTASIDFGGTYQEMKKQAEANLKQSRQLAASVTSENAVDAFAQFEKKAGLKITDELLPVLGNELAIGASLKQANMANVMGVPAPPAKTSSDPKDKDKPEPLPIVLIGIKNREAARRLMPRVFEGLGIGEANFLAQNERRGDSEIVNYAGIFSYAFVGNFLVLSDSETVRKVADANTNRTTLGANNTFRSARHWQPRQTQGEIYVSPVLMEGYQEQIGKQAASMDQTMRDFLMKLSPKASAITYTLTHDGLGSLHELHLPKNLILAMVAGTSATMSAMKEGSPEMNEMIAISVLHLIANGEENYKKTAGNGSYGSIDELVEHKMLGKEMLDKYGYRFVISTSSSGFEAVATPLEYGKSGKRSFFIDQSGVVRGDDKGGGPATVADKPVDQ